MEKLEEKFNENLELWKKHCEKTINSSNPNDYLDCEGFRNLVNLGTEVLPLIYDVAKKREYQVCFDWTFSSLIRKIVGEDFKIPENMCGKVEEIFNYTLEWLEKNMDKYIQKA